MKLIFNNEIKWDTYHQATFKAENSIIRVNFLWNSNRCILVGVSLHTFVDWSLSTYLYRDHTVIYRRGQSLHLSFTTHLLVFSSMNMQQQPVDT